MSYTDPKSALAPPDDAASVVPLHLINNPTGRSGYRSSPSTNHGSDRSPDDRACGSANRRACGLLPRGAGTR
jgi:hypothetical protein